MPSGRLGFRSCLGVELLEGRLLMHGGPPPWFPPPLHETHPGEREHPPVRPSSMLHERHARREIRLEDGAWGDWQTPEEKERAIGKDQGEDAGGRGSVMGPLRGEDAKKQDTPPDAGQGPLPPVTPQFMEKPEGPPPRGGAVIPDQTGRGGTPQPVVDGTTRPGVRPTVDVISGPRTERPIVILPSVPERRAADLPVARNVLPLIPLDLTRVGVLAPGRLEFAPGLAGRGPLGESEANVPQSVPANDPIVIPDEPGPESLQQVPLTPLGGGLLSEGVPAGFAALDRAIQVLLEPEVTQGPRGPVLLHWLGLSTWLLAAAAGYAFVRRNRARTPALLAEELP